MGTILSILLLLWAPQADDPQAAGLKALEEQRYEAAAELFQKAAASDPKDYAARFHLGLAYSLLNRDEPAIAAYREVLALKPGLYESQLNLGILLLRQRQAKEAVEFLRGAAGQKAGEFRPAYYLAEALLQAGDAAGAEAAFRTASGLDAKSADAAQGLARSLAKQGKLADADPLFRRVVELDPARRDALLELAALYEAGRENQKAIELYQQFPEEAAARERLGALQVEAGKYADSLPALEAAVKASPTAANRYALATAYKNLNRTPEAIELMRQVVEAEPGKPELRMTLGRWLRDQRNFGAAAQEFLRVAQAQPNSVPAWNELAGSLIMAEAYGPALTALDRIRALGAENAGNLFFRAIVLDKTKQLPLALESYRQFLQSSGGKHPDEEFKARQRIKVIEKELARR